MRNPFKSKFRITQEFGVNAEYYKKFGLKAHEGLDLVPTGTVWEVLCLADGVVVKDQDDPIQGKAYGKYVTIWHPSIKKATQYCHLASNSVSLGITVTQGQVIGVMGSTGNVTGAHLHLNLFEVDENGVRLNKDNGYLGGIDPLPFLNEEITPPITTALEECKVQVTKEIKAKEETYQELLETRQQRDGLDTQVKALQSDLGALGTLLGVSSDPNLIQGKVSELVSQEDDLRKCHKDRDEAKLQYQALEATIEPVTREKQEMRIELIKLQDEVSKLDRLLRQYREGVDLKVLFKIGKLYLARK